MSAKDQEILKQKISALPFTEDFKSFTQKNGFNTIGELTRFQIAALMKLEGFTYHALQELIQFLEERNLANLLKE